MAENNSSGLLKIALILYAIVCIVYGLGYFFIPDVLVKMSGSVDPIFHGWLRWSGGVLIALGIGAILVYLKPQNQGIFVTTIAMGTLFAGIALVWAWITAEEEANIWFTALPAIVVLVLSGLLWWSRQLAKAILYTE